VEIRRVQDARLVETLRLCAIGHAYYRERWRRAGVDPETIRGVGDLWRLPLTFKRDLMADPESFRLRCPDLPLHERALWEVVHTTGRTGAPTPIYITTHDLHANLFQARRAAAIVGIRDTDVLANLFPLTPAAMGSFVRAAENAYATGAAVAAALTGAPHGRFGVHRSLDEAVALVARHRASVLWGVTSFVRRVVMRAAELGADFSSVRLCALTGEASSAAMRADLRARLRALGVARPVIFDRYGSTEAGAMAQCREEGDWHNPAPEVLYHEVVDPDTGRPLPDGERGALALTHLDRRGTVLLRYVIGDVVSVTHEPCPHCGRHGDRLVGPVERESELIKVKGMLISPALLQEEIRAVPGVDEFQVVLTRRDPADPHSMDEMLLRVATSRTDRDTLRSALIEAAAAATGVRPRVEFTEANELYDPAKHVKAERFVDRRGDAEAP